MATAQKERLPPQSVHHHQRKWEHIGLQCDQYAHQTSQGNRMEEHIAKNVAFMVEPAQSQTSLTTVLENSFISNQWSQSNRASSAQILAPYTLAGKPLLRRLGK